MAKLLVMGRKYTTVWLNGFIWWLRLSLPILDSQRATQNISVVEKKIALEICT